VSNSPTPTTTITLQDPGFRLPPAVQASIDRANGMIAAQATPVPTAEDTPPADAADVTTTATEVTEPVTEPTAQPGKPTDWEGRYKAMKGRHDKAQEQIGALTADLSELRRTVAHLQAARPAAPAQPVQIAAGFTAEDLTDEERNDYGPDLLNVVEKVAGRKIASVIGAFEQKFGEIEQKVQGVTQVTQLSAKDRFTQSLTNRVPNWRQLNRDEGFLGWLDEMDQFSGQTRLALLQQAHRDEDAPRCAAIFEGYLQVANPPAAPQKETKSDQQPSGKVSLESLAAPGRARSAAPTPGPGDKPIIARTDIEKFFADVRRGLYRGNEAEKNRIEAEIFEATNEGRVR
jgi:hypothetical protein